MNTKDDRRLLTLPLRSDPKTTHCFDDVSDAVICGNATIQDLRDDETTDRGRRRVPTCKLCRARSGR